MPALERATTRVAPTGMMMHTRSCYMKKLLINIFGLAILLIPILSFSHVPQIVTGNETVMLTNPEISQAFYDELPGSPRVYRFSSPEPFTLFARILVPKTTNPDGRYSLAIYHVNEMRETVAVIKAKKVAWQDFYEPFANEHYLKGPEVTKQLAAGTYEIWVLDDHDSGKYVLAIGNKEKMSLGDIKQSVPVILQLKKDFFNESKATFALSIIGGIYLVTFLLLGALLAFFFQFIYITLVKKKFIKYRGFINLNLKERLLRLVIGIALLLIGLDIWSLTLFILAGFAFYQVIAGWCLLYAIIGRDGGI